MTPELTRRTLGFASIVFAVLVLVPSGAHLPLTLFLVGAQSATRWRQLGAALAPLVSAVARVTLNCNGEPADFARVLISLRRS